MNWADYPDFKKSEFDCKHTGRNNMTPEFMHVLQTLRTMYGRPMTITSGYRAPSHPVEMRKGYSTGEHTRGTCADIACVAGSDRYQMIRLAMRLNIPRIGIAKTFIHLGIGGSGLPSPVLWEYA